MVRHVLTALGTLLNRRVHGAAARHDDFSFFGIRRGDYALALLVDGITGRRVRGRIRDGMGWRAAKCGGERESTAVHGIARVAA
jgi:hypothetical protein